MSNIGSLPVNQQCTDFRHWLASYCILTRDLRTNNDIKQRPGVARVRSSPHRKSFYQLAMEDYICMFRQCSAKTTRNEAFQTFLRQRLNVQRWRSDRRWLMAPSGGKRNRILITGKKTRQWTKYMPAAQIKCNNRCPKLFIVQNIWNRNWIQ